MSITYRPSKRKRSKTHGYSVRSKSVSGRKMLKRRMQKGRKRLAP